MNNKIQGCLYLIPVPIGTNVNNELPSYNKEIINTIDLFVVEDLRTARRFLKPLGYQKPIAETEFVVYNQNTKNIDIALFMKIIYEGKNIGLMSESGIPCTADPGAAIVAYAHQKNIAVVPLVGASSIIMSLASSGFNGQNFAFNGYLPIEQSQRDKVIKELEKTVVEKNQTQIFIETPYRNKTLYEALLKNLNNNTYLSISVGLFTENQYIKTQTIQNWKKSKEPYFNKIPTIFLIGKNDSSF